ncbi:uncharacterized protein LOC132730344 [Ruditapes philippinarum]|uniref:uncharacterized protein LOC132730344 n=1 Tax=Ruditapes philippinarum TaxID=129788 RepID=UPI00295B9153|nr:uncharacterized protein LOC132730344 [Ruditapes philippinarum]
MRTIFWIIFSAVVCLTHVQQAVAVSPSVCQQCLQSSECNPPDCFCCRDELNLTNVSLSQIPQIVFFTFDDAVTEQVSGFYHQLFHESRKNPNGCPVSMTLFISHDNTKYRLVSEFYRKGMEIASHSVTHSTMNGTNFFQEAKTQKENLAKLANVPVKEITGWRSPFLKPTGDLQPDSLKKLGYTYDATLTFSKRSFQEKPPGPFTLDFGYPYECQVKPCPKHKHPGFWEVPVVSLLDYKQAYDCVYVDGCMNAPPDEDTAYQFLWKNFHNYYTTTRMPFGINMHPSWFFYPDRLKAMDRFIKKLVSLNDVYIISANRMLEWLKRPTPLQDLHSFAPWACDGSEKTFQTGPRLVKTNLPPPPPRSFISWTNNPGVTNYTPAPQPAIKHTLTKTRLFTPSIHNNESSRLIPTHQRNNLFTLDLSDNKRQPPQQNSNRWQQRQSIYKKVPSRDSIVRMRTRRPDMRTRLPEVPPPIIPRISQQDRLDQHEELMRRRQLIEEQNRQKKIIEQRQIQQRHQQLLEQQRQQEIVEKQRQDSLRKQNENGNKPRILWKPSSISVEAAQEAARPANSRRNWKPKIHQETVKVWPLIGQSFINQQNRRQDRRQDRRPDRQRVSRNRQRERFNTRNIVPDIQVTTKSRFAEVTAAPVPTPRRNINRFTESPRHQWYTDMRSRFGQLTNGPRFSRGGSNRRPGFVDTTPRPHSSGNSLPRQNRIQTQDVIRQQQTRERMSRRLPNPVSNNLNNDLNRDISSLPVRERTLNDIPTPSRSIYNRNRNVLHPTVAQQLAWNSFIRQMLGPHR